MAHAKNDIYYEIHGDGATTPVVLLMGLAVDATGWEATVPALARDRRVVILDNRGVGRSKKPPPPYSTAEMADDAAAVLDEIGVAHAHVVGVSLGGAIAQELALRHGERVKSLALIATFAKADEGMAKQADAGAQHAGAPAGSAVREAMELIAGGTVVLDPKQLMKFLMPLVLTPEYLQRERQKMRAWFERMLQNGFSSAGIAGQVAAAMAHDTQKALPGLVVPTLVVLGTADRLVPPAVTRRLAGLIPGATLVEIPDAPHGLLFENADALNALLSDWLKSHD